MKRLLQLVSIALAIVFTASPAGAQLVLPPASGLDIPTMAPSSITPLSVDHDALNQFLSSTGGKLGDRTQMLTYRLLSFPRYTPHIENGRTNTTFHYDPVRRRLYMPRIEDIRNASGSLISDAVLLLSSSIDSTNWDTTRVLFSPGTSYIYAAVSTSTLPGKNTNIVVSASAVVPGGTTPNLPSQVWYSNGTDESFSDVLVTPGDPASNPERTQIAGPMSTVAFNNGESAYAIVASALQDIPNRPTDPPSPTKPGAYGFKMFDFLAGDYVKLPEVPDVFRRSEFAQSPEGTYNSPIYIDSDPSGLLYAAHTTPRVGATNEDITNRLPQVSLSDDMGATWSSFASRSLSISALQQYATSRGWTGSPRMWVPYFRQGFMVHGEEHFSFVFVAMSVVDAGGGGNVEALDLVEAVYKDNVWTIRQVAEINDFPQELMVLLIDETRTRRVATYSTLQTTAGRLTGIVGWEIDMAKTADGRHLLVKWVDSKPNTSVRISPPVVIQQFMGNDLPSQDRQIDSLPSADIFIATRPIDGATWRTINVTNDDATEFGTVMPKVVPSLNAIPLLVHIALPTRFFADTALGSIVSRSNMVLYSRAVNAGITSIARADLSAVSVQESTQATSASIERIAPNPSITGSEISWAQVNPGHVTIQVVNVLGAVVKTAVNGMQEAGQHFVNLDVHDMAAGTYSIVLTVNGASISQPLVVVR